LNLIKSLAERRNEHILRKARPFLSEAEEVIDWVRARHPEDGRRGIFFITSERCIVHWSGRKDGHGSYEWDEFKDWDLDRATRGGPTLSIETTEGIARIQLVVMTRDMAATLRDFLRVFAELAPWPPDDVSAGNPNGRLRPEEDPKVQHHRRTPGEMAKRIILTVVGVSMIIIGIAIIPLPGPWSFVLNIAGLAILAKEYDWADDLLDWSKEKFSQARKRVRKRKRSSP
jgi:uncharacterized protein (TIGR02611 family)